jgi:hypothetical protein
MERQVRNSLEVICNLVYLARNTALTDAETSVRYLDLAQVELDVLVTNLAWCKAALDA